MHVPFGDLAQHYHSYKTEIDAAIQSVLESGWFVLGQQVERFEQRFADYVGVRHGVGVGSGTEAIHLALLAAGVRPGDQVITVPNTAIPTISAISFANAIPVFVDVDPKHYTIQPRLLEAAITEKTRAIVPVHLYGQCCDMSGILAIADAYGIPVVEDCAQAHGARWDGRKAGSFGDLGCFSFYPSKNLGALGDGGLVVTDDAELAERLRHLRNYGQTQRYIHESIGFNSRLDELQAAILSAQLPHLDAWNMRRREIADLYRDRITNPDVIVPEEAERAFHIYHLFVVQCPQRDELREHLAAHGVQTLIHYPIPCYLQQAYAELGMRSGYCPVAERLANCILSLPIYPGLGNEQIEYVAQCINEFVPGSGSVG
ncbi:DegT/DnrJ/EryC1/StrS family aminotransferase [candidate division KSB1 bacterium]|nr:DegT/DnrJ/EryC1/StrS family aminotransferase [candidate division KSB1 bacterium]